MTSGPQLTWLILVRGLLVTYVLCSGNHLCYLILSYISTLSYTILSRSSWDHKHNIQPHPRITELSMHWISSYCCDQLLLGQLSLGWWAPQNFMVYSTLNTVFILNSNRMGFICLQLMQSGLLSARSLHHHAQTPEILRNNNLGALAIT
jgi:hypothetical protein